MLLKDTAVLVSMDDKHKIKCGEPGYPVAAAERGKRVVVGPNQIMAVGDHDFTKCSLVPSVNLVASHFLDYDFFSIFLFLGQLSH